MRFYNEVLREIPDDFDVLDEHLNGISKADFCKAFKELRDITVAIYDDAIADPESYGFVKTDRKTGERKHTGLDVHAITCLLYALGKSGEINGVNLEIDLNKFRNVLALSPKKIMMGKAEEKDPAAFDKQYKKKHIAGLINKLRDFGFAFDGFDAGKEYSELTKLTVSHRNESLPTVLKVFAEFKICQKCFVFDFAKFNYKVFSKGKDEKLPFDDLYSVTYIPANKLQAAKALLAEMEELGLDYGFCPEPVYWQGPMACYYNFRGKLRIIQNAIGFFVFAPAPGNIPKAKVEAFLDSLPEKYKSFYAICGGCGGKKECGSRIHPTVSGKIRTVCAGQWPSFPAEMQSIPYISSGGEDDEVMIFCKTRKRIEVVITSLTRNQVVRKGTWVRIPPLPPY